MGTRLIKGWGAARVVGIDISAQMIALAQQQEEVEPMGIEYRVADAATLGGIGPVDQVAAAYLLHYAKGREQLLQMAQTVYDNLGPGQHFVASIANPLLPPQPVVDHRKYGFSFRLLDETLHEGARLRGTLYLRREDGGVRLLLVAVGSVRGGIPDCGIPLLHHRAVPEPAGLGRQARRGLLGRVQRRTIGNAHHLSKIGAASGTLVPLPLIVSSTGNPSRKHRTVSSIFISYARDDDEPFVEKLHQDLQRAGMAVWWDRAAMASRGRTFLQEIRDAIASSSRLVLVLGPKAAESEYVQAEWRLAMERCTPVVPILRRGEYGLLPPELARLHCVDVREIRAYDQSLAELVRILGESIPAPAPLLGVDALPRHFVTRKAELSRLSAILLADVQRPTVIRSAQQTASLQGMAGVGKSVLAAAFARECDTRRAFDSVVWLLVGPDAASLPLLQRLGEILADPAVAQASSLITARAALSAALADRSLLIVLDDVWEMSQVETVSNALGARCRLLVTTRDGGLAHALGAEELPLDLLDDEQALLLLARWSGQEVAALPPEAKAVAVECGYLPLALAMIGAMVRGRPDHWPHALSRLREADLQKIRQRFPGYPYPDLFRAIEVGVQALEPLERAAYLDLAVFREGAAIPRPALEALWQVRHGMSGTDVIDLADTLVNRSLARRNERGFLVLHALQSDFVRQVAGDLQPLHRNLLQGYRLRCPDGWASGPDDGYFFDSLAHHLALAGKGDELGALLGDYAWLEAKLQAGSVQSLLRDYDLLPPESPLRTVQRVLQLSTHVLLADRTQFAPQLMGRLVSSGDPAVKELTSTALRRMRGWWLQPLDVCLRTPDDALVATLTGHTDRVNALAVSADGRRAASASNDRTVRIWDLLEFRLLHTLTGHADRVNAVALTPDGRFAASGAGWPRPFKMEIQLQPFLEEVDLRPSRDTSVRIWNLDTRTEVRRLETHTQAVRAVICIANGRALVSGGDDGTLRLWAFDDDSSGVELGQQGGRVVFLAERSSHGQVFSFSEFNFKMWDLIGGGVGNGTLDAWSNVVGMDAEGLKVLLQHTSINGGAFNLEVWDLGHPDLSTEKIDHVDSFSSYIRTATYVNDRGSIAVGLDDGTIKVYEDMTAPARTLRGHRDEVTALVPTPNGKRLLSASYDGTLMLWDLTAAPGAPEHERDVFAVAFTPTGHLAVAAFSDGTVEVWDATARARVRRHTLGSPAFELRMVDETVALLGFGSGRVGLLDVVTGQLVLDVRGHGDAVTALDVEPTGALAASGSRDRRVKIWDLRERRERMTLNGHEAPVLGVAVLAGGERAVSGDTAGRWIVWDLVHGRLEHELRASSGGQGDTQAARAKWELSGPEMRAAWRSSCAVAALGDPAHCAAVADGSIVLWDAATGRRIATFDRPASSPVQTLRASHDRRLLMAMDAEHSCYLWEVASRQHLARFTFDASSLVCDISGAAPTLVAGSRGFPSELSFLQLHNSA